jgi:hypothetical protein
MFPMGRHPNNDHDQDVGTLATGHDHPATGPLTSGYQRLRQVPGVFASVSHTICSVLRVWWGTWGPIGRRERSKRVDLGLL